MIPATDAANTALGKRRLDSGLPDSLCPHVVRKETTTVNF